MQKHKHYDLIVAWAEGHTIQVYAHGMWMTLRTPTWNPSSRYRIKPEPKKYGLYRRKNSFGAVELFLWQNSELARTQETIESLEGFLGWAEPVREVYVDD